MAYWNKPINVSAPQIESVSLTKIRGGGVGTYNAEAFYEIEPGVVLDIILNKDNPYFNKSKFSINADKWPADVDGKVPNAKDLDYTWMGRALIRLIYTQRNIEKENLIWAFPLESNITEYPVLNEIVGVVSYLGRFFYTRKINLFNQPNNNADFNVELIHGGFQENAQSPTQGNRELRLDNDSPYIAFKGPKSKLRVAGGTGYEGVLGRYFLYNNRIRSLKRREGDIIIESRFGQSIRFGAYDDNRLNDKGYVDGQFNGYTDYKGDKTKYTNIDNNIYEMGGGNPMILIRNRQRPLATAGKSIKSYENLPPVIGTPEEKNVGGYIVEDINNDGSSIHMTSGVTISDFKTNCSKKMWGDGSEEQSGFNGTTQFKYPQLLGDQIVINSDRIILSSRTNEMFHYSKKRYAVITDDEYTVDAHNQMVFTTNNKTVFNSPAIYLGEYDQTNEPVLLGQTTVNWMYDLCQWLLIHTHWYKHSHPDAGQANPDKTQTTVQAASLTTLRDRLNELLSRRVFVVGGGLAPGKNGMAGSVVGGANPVVVTLPSGTGVPGGFTGANKKMSASERQKQQNDVNTAKTAASDAKTASNRATNDAAAAQTASIAANRVAIMSLGDSTVESAARTSAKSAKQSKIYADESKLHATEAEKFAKETEATDNDFYRIESKMSATNASTKAKESADKALEEKIKSENAAATAVARFEQIKREINEFND
jgi:hypothetical protein